MLHTKFQDDLSNGCGEEDFNGVFLTYRGMAAILVV